MASLDAPEDQGLGATQMHDAAIDAELVERPIIKQTVDEANYEYMLRLQELKQNNPLFEHENVKLDELDELEDELDEELLNKLKQTRLKELQDENNNKQNNLNNNSNLIKKIEDLEFNTEVIENSRYNPVILILYSESSKDSLKMLTMINSIAKKYPTIKFVKLIASEHILNFPLDQCPTILAYKDKNKLGQWSKFDAFAGTLTNSDCIEWTLSETGIFKTDLSVDPYSKILNDSGNKKKTKVIGKSTFRSKRDNSSDSDDD